VDKKETLPDWLAEDVGHALRQGVSLSVSRDETELAHDVTGIHWHPGDPNILAEAIIKYVQGEMRLDLNGHKYVIKPA